MDLRFDEKVAVGYKSSSQKIRVLSEDWVDRQIFCPNCGHANIDKYESNRPVADFYCVYCGEDYELKSKRSNIGKRIVDGAYEKMIERIGSDNSPNFFLLSYSLETLQVLNFLVIPKHFFVPNIIERRRPLAATARRAGWIGCNILLQNIPHSGKIFFVKDQQEKPRHKILTDWQKTLFLREEKEVSAKGWLLDVMRCIDRLGKREFSLTDVYAFVDELARLHPDNRHVKDKIRQQLQILRDRGYLDFVSPGFYCLV